MLSFLSVLRSSARTRLMPLAAGLVALAAALLPAAAFAQQEQVVDEIVAVVGDQIILRSEVDGLVYSVMQQGSPYSPELWREALNQLIDQEVLTIHAKRDTLITVNEDQVTQSLDQRIQQMTAQVGGTDRLEELYGQSIVQLRADLRDEVRDRLLAEQFQGRKVQSIKVTPSEVETWFEQIPVDSLPPVPEVVRVSHVVRYPQPSQEALAEAREIVSAIRDSVVSDVTPLEDLARRYSEDVGSAQEGGRIRDISLSDLVPEFAAVASRIPIGEVSEVFETEYGYHILRVNERRGDVVDFNHILIKIDQSRLDPSDTLDYLATLRDSVVAHSVPFEQVARRHSDETFTAQRGGRVVDPRSMERDLVLEALGPTWQRTLATLEESEISEPAAVELLDGQQAFHIVRLDRRTPAHRMNLETDYERIERFVLQEKRAEIIREWLDGLRKRVYVDVRGEARDLSMARN